MKKLWITGESSFISRNFVKWCDEHPGIYEVVNRLENKEYDYFRGHFSGYKNYEKEIDIFDPTLLTLIDKSGAEVILHNAGLVGTDYCTNNPETALRTNIEGTFHIIKIAQKIGIPLIFTSTSVCYQPTNDIISEDYPLEPKTIYGMTKLACENLLSTWMKKDYVVLVPAMLFGSYDLHSASNKLIMSGLGMIEEPVNIYLDPLLPKPFFYIDNYLDGLDVVLKNIDKLNCQRINIAPDPESVKSFESVINYVTENMGLEPHYQIYPEKDYLGGHILDNSKLKSLGWTQKISMEQGLELVGSNFKKDGRK